MYLFSACVTGEICQRDDDCTLTTCDDGFRKDCRDVHVRNAKICTCLTVGMQLSYYILYYIHELPSNADIAVCLTTLQHWWVINVRR